MGLFLTIYKGVKALVSVGGWTGSLYYSSAVATSENRTAFVGAITSLAKAYNLDGVDFEYVPVLHTAPCVHHHIVGNTQTNKGLDVI